MGTVRGARVVVVGASSGLGRAIGVGLGQQGARVALLARRASRVEDAAREAGGNAVAVACDVRDEEQCGAAVDEAAAALGGIDGLVYCAAIGPLAPLAESDAALWRAVLDTNVVGASLITRAAVPHLEATAGRAVYLSSTSASATPPWTGLGAYATSKAALDKLVEAWQVEHPTIGFTRFIVGNTAGGEGAAATEFAAAWDPDRAAECFPAWQRLGYLDGELVGVEDLIDVTVSVLSGRAAVPVVMVRGRASGP